VRTLGIDLAASPDRTGAATIDWTTGTVTLHERPLDDRRLLALAADGIDKIGIDVPLGWPDAFIDAVAAHRRAGPGPDRAPGPPPDLDSRDPADHRRTLRYRRTDLHYAARTGSWPLSVSSDLIAVPTMRYAALEPRLRAIAPVDRSGTTGLLAETYPAGSLRVWGLANRGYKGKAGTAVRAELAEQLVGELSPLALTGDTVDRCRRHDDDLDAVVCALVAAAVRIGRSTGPPPEHRDQAGREGWIHVPTVELAELVSAVLAPA